MRVDIKQCFCVGPQNGQPLCPCRMLDVKIVNGRYVQTIDHGPAPSGDTSNFKLRKPDNYDFMTRLYESKDE